MYISRRSLLLGATALTAVSCASTGYTMAQGIADLSGIVSTLRGEEALFAPLFPNVVTPNVQADVDKYLGLAEKVLNGLTPDAPTVTTNMSTAMQYVNIVLRDISAIAGLAASADPRIAAVALTVEAAIALAPEAEALITALIQRINPGSARATLTLAALKHAVNPRQTPAQARAILKIKTVG